MMWLQFRVRHLFCGFENFSEGQSAPKNRGREGEGSPNKTWSQLSVSHLELNCDKNEGKEKGREVIFILSTSASFLES